MNIARLVEEDGLSPGLIEDAQGYMPAQKLFNFIRDSEMARGIEHFGWQSGIKGDLGESGSWAEHVAHASTLRRALQRLIEHYPLACPLV